MEECNLQVPSKRVSQMDSFASSSGGSNGDACAAKNSPPLAGAAQAGVVADELHKEQGPLSGKPFFHIMFSKSYSRQLLLPWKIHSVIPCGIFATSIAYLGLEWSMVCDATGKQKRFFSGWGQFVVDNNIGEGDACVFELLELSSGRLKFKSQILRNRLPSVILQRMKGDNAASAIVLE